MPHKDPDVARIKHAEYYANNKERIKARVARYRLKHIDEIREKEKLRSAREYPKKKAYYLEWSRKPENREKRKMYSRKYYSRIENRIRRRNWGLMDRYGICEKEYNDLFLKQLGLCAICCSIPLSGHRKLYVDHDHLTGVVRGLLCHNCNVALGLFKDNLDILAKAIGYLGSQNRELSDVKTV